MATLTTAERTTLKLLLDSLSGDPAAINTLFGVSGLGAQRTSESNFLRSLTGDAQAINAVFGISDPILNVLTDGQRGKFQSLLLALSGDAPSLDLFANGFAATPLTLPGAGSLGGWLSVDRGITLGSTLHFRGSGAGVITLTGNLAQSSAVYGIVMATGTLGVSMISFTIDGGLSFEPVVPTATNIDLGNGIVAHCSAANYNIADNYTATVAQWVEQKFGYVFAQATATKQPDLIRTSSGLAIHADGVDDLLISTTAGVASSFASAAAPFSLFLAMRSGQVAFAGEGIWSVSRTTATTPIYNLFTANTTALWSTFSGSAANSAVAAGAGALATLELWNTGTAANLIVNGATLINAIAQTNNLAATVDQMVLFGTNSNSVAGTWGEHYLSEVIWYTGNQHAVTSAPITAYLNGRWSEQASTLIADAKFFDSLPSQTSLGVTPTTWIPEDYRVWAPDKAIVPSTTTVVQSRRLVVNVPAGVTTLLVSAVPFDNTSISSPNATVSCFVDGAYRSTLTYAGALGLKQTQSLPLDGAAHTIQLDEIASIVGVVGVGGTVTLSDAAAPNTRVVCYGDSITEGFKATIPSNGWAQRLRHALSATYGTMVWGVPSKLGFSDYGTAPLVTASAAAMSAMLDGAAKNIVINNLGTNDWGIGQEAAAAYATILTNWVVALIALVPTVKIILFSPISRVGESTPNTGGSTLQQVRTAIAGVQVAHSANCTYVDGGLILPDTTTTYLADGLHPTDAGYVLIASALQTAVQAL